jgi:thioredoxin reductase
MSQSTDVAIIGAGPNALSLAAHLGELGVQFRIFGKPMESWLDHMPRGMLLKSEGFASNLYDPLGRHSLRQFCEDNKLPYADMGLPVPLEVFCDYGLAFQRRAVPTLEKKLVVSVTGKDRDFHLGLDDGEMLHARRVVVATGISHLAHVPRAIAHLPADLLSHGWAHADLARFKGADVTVVGGGASAIDIAALLHDADARVRLVARRPILEVHSRMRLPRPLSDRLSAPMSGIGPSWRSWFFTEYPGIFHHLPADRRLRWVRTHLGPAAGWFMAQRIARVPQLLGYGLNGAKAVGGQAQLELVSASGVRSIKTDHVIAATGYRPALDRLKFIDPELRAAVKTLALAPVLSSNFQSSVAGLYFMGPIAANSFGPVMRFAVGAKFAARRLSQHLASGVRQKAVGMPKAVSEVQHDGSVVGHA